MAAPGSNAPGSKLFLGGLSYDSTEQTILDYFKASYGEDQVLEAQVVRDRATNQSRGFGFVTFSDAEVALTVQRAEHTIDGRSVMARRATPKGENPRNNSSGGYHGGGMLQGGGGGYGGGNSAPNSSYTNKSSGAAGWEDRSYGNSSENAEYESGRSRRKRGVSNDNNPSSEAN